MALHSDRYLELVERMGGVNPDALQSFVYLNNPLALKHWTQNVAELLYITGALFALRHAIQQVRQHSDGRYLAFWLSMIVYCFVIEVPVYFPQLIGLPPNVIFIHNEFTLGFVFNQTPLYIICLYPALLYTCYIVVERMGIFERHNVVVGAICVGFVHSVLYEIFDHYGIQYNWWIWDYENPVNELLVGGVPLFSIANFSVFPPVAMTLLARLLLFGRAGGSQASAAGLAGKTLLIGVLTPIVMCVIAPTTLASFFTQNGNILTWVSWITMAVAAAVTVYAFRDSSANQASTQPGSSATAAGWTAYPFAFIWAYLAVFMLLWIYGLGDYFAAVDGVVQIETTTGPVDAYTGSLPYVLACYVFSLYFLFRIHSEHLNHAVPQAG